jgi:hypothetical protein
MNRFRPRIVVRVLFVACCTIRNAASLKSSRRGAFFVAFFFVAITSP